MIKDIKNKDDDDNDIDNGNDNDNRQWVQGWILCPIAPVREAVPWNIALLMHCHVV